MDLATRFTSRVRAGSHFDTEGNFTAADASPSSGESEANFIRRKFQRTSTDPEMTTASADNTTFRKPSFPASATRSAATGPERLPSLNQHQRRRSNLQRENVRVPSGPRDFPSSGKQRKGSTASTAPSVADSTNTTRSFLTQPGTEAYFYNSGMASSQTHLTFANPTDHVDGFGYSSAASTPFNEGGVGFLPDVNFDDFQTTIKKYDASPQLNDYAFDSGSTQADTMMARNNGFGSRGGVQQQQQQTEQIARGQSLRQRLASGRQNSSGQQRVPSNDTSAPQAKDESFHSRRQSSIAQTATLQGPTASATAKPPRKSVGPGMITNMMKGNTAQQQTSLAPPENTTKSALARNSSFTKSSRRTTIQPAASAGAELPRVSTLTAATQSRQNKVKSLQPPPKEPDPRTTPTSTKSKNSQNRAHTPSSSGNRRQSIVAGRAPSGLGARTISPTDARRLKRMSMMNPPPMPSTANLPKGPTPTPQEEITNSIMISATNNTRLPELPRMTQPSPSMIPRRTSNRTPSSARVSPEGRSGGVSLTSKSSFSSLTNTSLNASSSRLPTPKPRNGTQSSSSLGQYRDQYGEPERYSSFGGGGEELVPPVPAIPKAYESPKDLETAPPFFASSLKSSQSGLSDPSSLDRYLDGSSMPNPWTSQTSRSSFETASESPRKISSDMIRKRNNALSNGADTAPPPSAPPKTVRAQPDPNGRKNANLQPLRLPPLNLVPFSSRTSHNKDGSINLPRPSDEIDMRDDYMSIQTPEPKRTAKTPSTPMTASKATFFRRHDDANKALRSSSSHHALRDLMGMDPGGKLLANFWDDSDVETSGVPIPAGGNHARNAITPFSSGSLPKGSGEFARLRGRPSGEYWTEDDPESPQQQSAPAKPQGPRVRAQRGATVTSTKSSLGAETPMSLDSPAVEAPAPAETKKEEKPGLRRKLSLSWRRSSSKSANHAENKGSPQESSSEREKERKMLQKQMASEMPPPKLPASATWSGDVPSLPSSTRPSLDSIVKRKSQVPTSISTTSLVTTDSETANAGVKTRSQHTEQPTPVSASSNVRASSWGTLGATLRSSANKPASNARHRFTASTLSAMTKDKDDHTADDEMAKLSRKRKDVDATARESEDLKKRAIARSPVTAEHVLHDRSLSGGAVLNVYERGEIVDYEREGIYFTGTKAARKIIGSLNPSPQPTPTSTDKNAAGGSTNSGYDDERGDYNIVVGDHLMYRFEVVDVLGKGSFGQVVRCVDHKDGDIVAVKIIRNKKRFHQQALVEVGILGRLREWDPHGAHATLSITSSFYFRSHLCIVTPCLSINLYELIRAHNFVGFSLPLIRRFARQLLACLTLLQTKRIIHCDLKPENILLCEARKADVRVIDFGSSCREEEKVYTYIQSRFYRSPEVILGSSYGLGIDMWSLGCILAELWSGYPIFPGENEQEQLACIMEIFGPPDRHLVERCTRKKLFFDSVGKPRVTVSSKGRRRRPSSKTLQQALKTEDEAFVDFISRCLRWDPDRRLKPSEAVSHPFITNMPMTQRPGIPDEARRAARVRSTAAVPTTNGQTAASPVKRSTANSGNAFTSQTSTPARDRARALPETPQTAVRNGVQPTASNNLTHGSPIKTAAAVNPNRRHSTVPSAAAMAGSKRASNGAVVGTTAGVTGVASSQQQRGGSANLAVLAAAAAGNAAQSSAARWRS